MTGVLLTTARLRLEPFDACHAEGLLAMNADPEVMRYISGRPDTRADTLRYIERVRARWAAGGPSWWSFIERAGGQLVGAGCIQPLRRGGSEPDPACPLEIGWRLRRDRWRQGLASEAAVAMAGYAFDTLLADELLAVCHPDNRASAALMRRLGMAYRGIERWYERDMATYAMTRAAWQAQRAAPGGPRTC